MIKNRKMSHIGIPTSDYAASMNFYVNELGFEVIGEFNNGSGPCGFIRNQDCIFEFWEDKERDPVLYGQIDHYAFESEDIEADYKECLDNGYKIITKGIQGIPTLFERGNRYFIFETPTGQKIEFCQIL